MFTGSILEFVGKSTGGAGRREQAKVIAVPKRMGIGTVIFHLAVIPWFWIKALLLVGLTILTLVRAVKKTEIGYENETGFHYGNEEDNYRKASRSAHPLSPLATHSCLHSRIHENRTPSRHARPKTG